MKAKAIRVQRHGGPEVLELVEVDVGDPGPDEVRIRQHAIGLNYIDTYYRTGLYTAPLPHGIGNEAAGVVEAVGSNVKFLKEGDRVAYPQSPVGAYADVRVMPAATVVKIPAKLSFEQAAPEAEDDEDGESGGRVARAHASRGARLKQAPGGGEDLFDESAPAP